MPYLSVAYKLWRGKLLGSAIKLKVIRRTRSAEGQRVADSQVVLRLKGLGSLVTVWRTKP